MGLHVIDRKETLFDHIYFIPAGQVVDAVTVDKDNWPDNTPDENYGDYKLKEIGSLKPFQNVENNTEIYVSETAPGYTEEDDATVKNRGFTFDTGRTNLLYKMLEKGLAGLPVPGTAYTPGENKKAYRDGVLLHLTGDVKLGVIIERELTWARVELTSPGDHANKTSQIQVKVTKMDADNNSYVLVDLEA